MMFSTQSVSRNPLIATFQLSPAASLNLGLCQNGVYENGLIWTKKAKILLSRRRKKSENAGH